MRDISKEIISYQSAIYVAKALNIKPVMLKKYSPIIEKMSKGNVTFKRSEDRLRLYAGTDVILIRKMLDIRDQNDLNYEKAVETVLKEEKILDDTDATLKNDSDVTVNYE